MRWRSTVLIALPALFVVPTPLAALAFSLPPDVSDMIEVTDDSGTPVMGSDGKPVVGMILESAENTSRPKILPYRPPPSADVTLTVGNFQLLGSRSTTFVLGDGSDPAPDVIGVFVSGGGLEVDLCEGASCPLGIYGPGPNPAIHSVIETGQPQEIDVLPSPFGSGNLHVIVDSIEAVPEPSSFVLLAAGLGVVSIEQRRRAARGRNDRTKAHPTLPCTRWFRCSGWLLHDA
jgi:hypothetical protein